jgi:23S rRNA pseudouridine2605 synthase
MKMEVRLNKFLAECGIASRRKAEEYITQGRVTINGKTVMDLATKIDEDTDTVALDGEKIKTMKKVYYVLNKPKGVVTTTDDEKGRMTVIDLIKTNVRIFPIGRLDYNTTGVLLLTNDGDFADFLLHPKNQVPREYLASIDKPLSEEHRFRLLNGVMVDNKQSRFKSISYPAKNNFAKVLVVTDEGRNHFVKNMFACLGYTVKTLHRKKYAGITADNMSPAGYRELTKSEIAGVFKKYKK